MARFSDAFLDELRTRSPIVDVIGARLTWDGKRSRPARGDYWACCPFHDEKTPSFHVSAKTGYFYCFGCHEKGGAIDFLMKMDRLSFPEAVARLAEQAGLALPVADPQMAHKQEQRETLTDVTEKAVSLFREALAGAAGAKARAYLNQRGLSQEVIDRFEIGLALGSRNGLTHSLCGDGVDMQKLVDVDLAVASDNGGGFYDRFQNRLMFPIRNAKGRCVAFGGRDLTGAARAKYLNSRETVLFSKRGVLYNIAGARQAMNESARGGATPAQLIVVEGYMDVIALAQFGFQAAVAPLGTAMGEDQFQLLWQLHGAPVLALDGDVAGMRAADRAAERALPAVAPGRSLAFAMLPSGHDPDDFLRSPAYGPDAFRALIDSAEPLFERLWRREAVRDGLETPEQRAALDSRLDSLAGQIQDPAVRRHYGYAFRGKTIAHFRANRQPAKARGAGGGYRGAAPSATESARSTPLPDGPEVREAVLALTLLNHPSLVDSIQEDLVSLEISSSRLDSFLVTLLSAINLSNDPETVQPEEIARAVDSRLGSGVCDALIAEFGRRMPPSSALGASPNAALEVMRESVCLLKADVLWRQEKEEFSRAAAEDESAVYQFRAQEAWRATRSMRSAMGTEVTDEDEDDLSAQLKAFVDGKPWIKRRKRAQ